MYSEPKLQIFQEFEAALAGGTAPLYACILGPNYALHRFSVEAERALLGNYHFNVPSEVHSWVDHEAGAVIDLTNAKVQIKDTKVRYYNGVADGHLTVDNGNRVISGLVFKSNAAAARTPSAFGNRDAQIGDLVRVNWISGVTQQMMTKVAGFVADVVPGSSTPSTAPFWEHNFGVAPIVVHVTPLTTPPNPTKYTIAYDATDYDGLPDGYPQDVYTIQVLALGTTGTGGLDGTRFRITSAGNDVSVDLTLGVDVAWDGAQYPVPLGARGAYMNFTNAGGTVDLNDLWQVEIGQDYDLPSISGMPTGVPAYIGTKNTKYIITVIEGGCLNTAAMAAGDVRISYRTSNGADIEGYLTIPAADFDSAPYVSYPIGVRNMQLTFYKGTFWNTGDQFSFCMQGQAEGPYHTLVLQDPIPTTTATSLSLEMMVLSTVEFPKDFYTATQDQITILGSATILSDLLGFEKSMAIFDGQLFADYREMRTDNANRLGIIRTVTENEEILGPAVPENPLAKAVYHALENSGGVAVYYMLVDSNDLAGYIAALDVLTENDEVYGLVPLTDDLQVKELFRIHVLERSNDINNQWRIDWIGDTEFRVAPIYTEKSGGADIEGTVSEYPSGMYKKLNAAGALFITNNVDAGDTIRINYRLDPDGNLVWDEYTVDRVDTEEQIILVEDVGSPISVAIKIEVWRTRTKYEYAQALASYCTQFNTRRNTVVWADNPVEVDGSAMPLYYLCAALSGQRSGVPPHAPLSQVDLLGIALDPQIQFSRDELNIIASGGVWIVNKDFSGRVYTRHQVTSVNNPDDFPQREQSKTTNLDHISRSFYAVTKDLFGQGNISPDMIALIKQRLIDEIEEITNRPYSAKIGPQMLGATILKVQQDPVLRDTVVVEINPGLPDPLNNLPITFKVS